MTTDNGKKPEDEKIDLGADAVEGVADFVTDAKKRNAVYQAIGWGIDAVKKLATITVYLATNIATGIQKATPAIKATVGGVWNFGAKVSENWRTNFKNNFSELDEFGNTRSCMPKTVKGWWQTVNFPAAVVLTVATGFAVAELPWVAVADYKDDPIYKMHKPQTKLIGGEKEWTVTCNYLDESQSEEDAECAFSIPDNSWLDMTYRLSNPLSISGWFTGYSPRTHVSAQMLAADSQYCAINSIFDKPVFGAEKNLPAIYRAPVCADTLDELKTKLTTDVTNKDGDVIFEAGEIIEDDGNYWYRAADQSWAITGWLASAWVTAVEAGGGALDSVGEWVDEITTPDPEEEAPAEEGATEEAGKETTSLTDFNTATGEYASNQNYNVEMKATITLPASPTLKVA